MGRSPFSPSSETQSPGSRCGQGHAPSEGPREGPGLFIPGCCGDARRPLSLSLQILALSSHGLLPGSPLCPFSLKRTLGVSPCSCGPHRMSSQLYRPCFQLRSRSEVPRTHGFWGTPAHPVRRQRLSSHHEHADRGGPSQGCRRGGRAGGAAVHRVPLQSPPDARLTGLQDGPCLPALLNPHPSFRRPRTVALRAQASLSRSQAHIETCHLPQETQGSRDLDATRGPHLSDRLAPRQEPSGPRTTISQEGWAPSWHRDAGSPWKRTQS